MKKVNTAEMRAVEGGKKVTVTAKCSKCGKKFKGTENYYWFQIDGYKRAKRRATIYAERMLDKHELDCFF